jgi:hypothetical protein
MMELPTFLPIHIPESIAESVTVRVQYSPATQISWPRAVALAFAFAISVTSPLPAESQGTPDAQTAPLTRSISPYSITGSVVDQDGAVIANATIMLTQPEASVQKTISAGDGTFNFLHVRTGSFELTVEAPTFASKKISGEMHVGQPYWAPPIQLSPATKIEVEVAETQEQIAEEQIHVEEQQRVLGFIPNFYVSYEPNPVPLNVRQKFQLAWKASINPASFGIAAFFAGLEQADNFYSGYGQGWQGYGKRLGATYADSVSGTFIGGAIFPTVFKQDPRYYYKGAGTRNSRVRYALASAFRCKGDNGKWQPNYSSMLGGLASGALSNLYYPAANRNGVALTFENTLIGIGGNSLGAVFQEFFVRKFTPHTNPPDPMK